MNNPIIHRIMDEFVHGRIITREEMLSQMVVMLAKDWTAERDKAMRDAMTLANMNLISP